MQLYLKENNLEDIFKLCETIWKHLTSNAKLSKLPLNFDLGSTFLWHLNRSFFVYFSNFKFSSIFWWKEKSPCICLHLLCLHLTNETNVLYTEITLETLKKIIKEIINLKYKDACKLVRLDWIKFNNKRSALLCL